MDPNGTILNGIPVNLTCDFKTRGSNEGLLCLYTCVKMKVYQSRYIEPFLSLCFCNSLGSLFLFVHSLVAVIQCTTRLYYHSGKPEEECTKVV